MGSFSSNRKLHWSDGNLIARNLPDQPIAEPGCRRMLTTELPRGGVPRNWASGVYHSRKLRTLKRRKQGKGAMHILRIML